MTVRIEPHPMHPVHLPQLRRIRWAVRAVLLLGVAASVAANILHARPNPVAQTIAAWPPLALLLTVELIARVPMHRRGLAWVRIVATGAIACIGAWVSYWHMAGVAARYGEEFTAAHLIPFSVDGLVVVASVCLVELGGRLRAATMRPDALADAVVDAVVDAVAAPASAPASAPDPVPAADAQPPAPAAAGVPRQPAAGHPDEEIRRILQPIVATWMRTHGRPPGQHSARDALAEAGVRIGPKRAGDLAAAVGADLVSAPPTGVTNPHRVNGHAPVLTKG